MNWLFWRKSGPQPGPQAQRAVQMGFGKKGPGEVTLDTVERADALERRVESLEKRMEEIAPWLAP